ncbi:MAG: twin-arginine translocase TatA/TatE family subunit [Planctomycetes bacterium]|nr:twin-arginine translocase TatA/TatE family subunit [Planctomycetota bacterium]
MSHIAFLNAPSPMAMLILLIIALLLFGKKLPEVARSLGKGIIEFKKGMQGIEDDMDKAGRHSPPPPDYHQNSSQNAQTSQASQNRSDSAPPSNTSGGYPRPQD